MEQKLGPARVLMDKPLGVRGQRPREIFFWAHLAHSCETDFQVLGFYVVWLPCFSYREKRL